MRRIHIDHVLPGARLAKSIFTPDGKILLAAGVELKSSYLDRLKGANISEVYIEDGLSYNIEIEDVVCDHTRQEAKMLVKKMMSGHVFSNTVDIDEIKEMVDDIIDEILRSPDLLTNLTDIRRVDDYTFEHSVNVCILSIIIGVSMNFSLSKLRDLGVGALLHDIGKLKVPESILKKPSQLTAEEFEEIKKHTVYGYELLKDNEKISIVSAYIAYGHHERLDGSGYPLQLKSESIHQCARIVAVADVFDALTSDRVYRKRIKAHEVFEYITSIGLHHFDQMIVDRFVKNIALYPVGTGVVLSTGEKALVVRNNRNMPTRPVVRVVYDSNGCKLTSLCDLDLATKRGVCIVDSCEIA